MIIRPTLLLLATTLSLACNPATPASDEGSSTADGDSEGADQSSGDGGGDGDTSGDGDGDGDGEPGCSPPDASLDDGVPPRLLGARFSSFDTVELTFSEPMACVDAVDPAKFRLAAAFRWYYGEPGDGDGDGYGDGDGDALDHERDAQRVRPTGWSRTLVPAHIPDVDPPNPRSSSGGGHHDLLRVLDPAAAPLSVNAIRLLPSLDKLELTLSEPLSTDMCAMINEPPDPDLVYLHVAVDFAAAVGDGMLSDLGGLALDDLHPQWVAHYPGTALYDGEPYNDQHVDEQEIECAFP